MLSLYGTIPFAARHYFVYSSNLSTIVKDNNVLTIQAVTDKKDDTALLESYTLSISLASCSVLSEPYRREETINTPRQ